MVNLSLYFDDQKVEFIWSKAYTVIHTSNAKQLKQVTDFKYLGSHITFSENYFKVRKGFAWNGCGEKYGALIMQDKGRKICSNQEYSLSFRKVSRHVRSLLDFTKTFMAKLQISYANFRVSVEATILL